MLKQYDKSIFKQKSDIVLFCFEHGILYGRKVHLGFRSVFFPRNRIVQIDYSFLVIKRLFTIPTN